MSLFDGYKATAHDVVSKLMGTFALYTPKDSEVEQREAVLFNDPETIEKLGEIEYGPNNCCAEYRFPFFPELKPNADSGITEVLTINSVEYYVQKVKKMFDGHTFIAILEVKTDE